MELNKNYFIKVLGKANIPRPLAIGHNFKIVADCSITQEKTDDNHDGSVDITYKAEPITVEITNENGKTIRAKDPRRNSVKIRNMLWKQYFNEGEVEDFDQVYDAATWVIISMMPHIYREALKRLEEKGSSGDN